MEYAYDLEIWKTAASEDKFTQIKPTIALNAFILWYLINDLSVKWHVTSRLAYLPLQFTSLYALLVRAPDLISKLFTWQQKTLHRPINNGRRLRILYFESLNVLTLQTAGASLSILEWNLLDDMIVLRSSPYQFNFESEWHSGIIF